MKKYIKLVASVAVGGFMAACAEQDIAEYNVEMPEGLQQILDLRAYDNIKDYVDYGAYPNFKIACALGADEYNAKGVAYRVANMNFDEITLGNAMKYASVVADDGTLDFTVISELLDNAEEAGMSVYGHTLAWHAQQNVTYLNSLIADEELVFTEEDRITDLYDDYSTLTAFPYDLILDSSVDPVVEDGVLKVSCKNKKDIFYLAQDVTTIPGTDYEFIIECKGSKKGSIFMTFGDSDQYTLSVDTEFMDYQFHIPATKELTSLRVEPGKTKIDLEIKSVYIGHYPSNLRQLTPEEKAEKLTDEMNRWIAAMMEACNGRVKAWDVINEAISGDGNVNGYYDLQHGNSSESDFFWQDYLGSEDYGPIVCKAARKAYEDCGGNANELKLFVNDYNLESDWDRNKKLKSLIYWVGVWEKGGAKIDGLSSQMHISYYEDENTMASKSEHMVNMLTTMAETGKLVRISELDMGYVDIDGYELKTQDLNEEQLQNMANYYQFIIQMYLKIVPPEQQYSICQWCLTDAPAASGWRPGEPVGLWTENWERKSSYVAFCEAFKQELPATNDYFEYLKEKNLKHYISQPE